MKRSGISAASPSKLRKVKSEIWNDFDRVIIDGELRAKCKHCQKKFSGSSKSGTTHLRNHLKRCSAIKSEKSCKEMIYPSQTGDLKNPIVIDRNSVFDEEKSSLDVVRMIIKHGYPLNMIEHERFSIFVENLQPRFKLPSRDTLKAGILRVYGEEKEKLRKYFEMLSCRFHLILNFLTCHDKKNRYCCFTLQFSEDGLKLKKKILALKSLENNYTGETLCEMVKGLLLEWKINKKLCSITVEHSSSNKKMVHNLVTWLDLQGYPPHKRTLFHIPCITHIINLLVQDGLDGIVLILHKTRKAIKYFSETADGAQKFHEVDLTSQRWDSIFLMLQSALKYEATFLQSRGCDFPENISMEEWNSAKAIVKSVLDPRSKLDFVHFSLKDVYGEGTTLCKEIKDDFFGIFYGYAEAFSSQPYRSSSSYGNNDCDVRSKWYKSKRDLQREELDRYLEAPPSRNEELDVLGWWHTNGEKFPTLWRMARDILAIPMSTSISNSAFFIEPMTINSIFNDLDPDIIEASTCGGDWLDNPIRITPNKDNDHSPAPTYSPSVFAGTYSSLETQEKHSPFTADTVLMLGNPGSTSCPDPLPTRDTSLHLSSSSLSFELQPQEKHNSSTANAELMLENHGSISGPEPLQIEDNPLHLELQQDHNPSNADTRLQLASFISTSCPGSLPAGTAPEVGEILRRIEAQGLQHSSMRSHEYSWSPPPSSWLKFNVGAEVHYSTFLAAVLRNDAGNVVEADIANIAMDNVPSSLVAGALAFRYAAYLIKQYSVRRAIIEGDAPLVVNALKDRKTDAPLEINDIVQDVFAMLDTCTDTIVDFSCVNKSCNSLAYDCIKWATKNMFGGVLPPSWFSGASFIGPSGV